jgi:hypothetical protein
MHELACGTKNFDRIGDWHLHFCMTTRTKAGLAGELVFDADWMPVWATDGRGHCEPPGMAPTDEVCRAAFLGGDSGIARKERWEHIVRSVAMRADRCEFRR